MASPRRIGAEDSKTRAILLDAAERLMLEEGYAAVTSRRVAAKAGLKPQLVHYYFRTMDELFLAVYRRRASLRLGHYERALASDQPLRSLWEISTDPRGTAFTMEFAALANHRKAIRAEIAQHAERFRQMQLDATASVLKRAGISPEACPPIAVVLAMTGVSQVLVLEKALGITSGHEETRALVERYLRELEGPARTKPS
ncbi:MAG: TetR/AcrR family transcriptional regulator [Deltaproteobacteria bacterium]|nr:TetR/AcrR family transcriptional regulator [Deltaproteobacteria bacterium]